MQQIIEKIIQAADCSVSIDSVKDGRLCGVITEKTHPGFLFLFGYTSKKGVLYPTLEQYGQAFPSLISWRASGVAILDGMAYAISRTAKKPFSEFLS